MPCFRHTSPADSPAACSFSTLMICSSVNLLLRMSVSSEERTLPKIGGIYGEQVKPICPDGMWVHERHFGPPLRVRVDSCRKPIKVRREPLRLVWLQDDG